MRFRNLVGGIALCALILLASPAKAQTDPNAIFATVNGENIKSIDFWHRLAWYRIDPNNPLARLPAGFLAINQMITEHLVYQMARDKGCAPTDLEVEAELKKKEAQDPTLVPGLKAEARPESDLYEQIKFDLTEYKLRTFGILMTDQEVEQHYRQYPGEFTVPKQYKLKVIVVNSDDEVTAVDKELSGGKPFADVAKAHSLDVSKDNGGDFGTVSVNSLGTPAANALNSIKIGQTTDWVSGQNGQIRVKYLLIDTIPSKVRPLDDALREQIRRKLSLDKGNVRNPVNDDLEKSFLSAKVVINQPGFQKIYNEMIISYSKLHPTSQ